MYWATGKTLASWVLSEQLQSSFGAYLDANWSAAAKMDVDTAGLPYHSETALNALGSAAVTTGRDRFASYATERLARLALERALRAHWEGRNVPREVKPEAAKEEAARNHERDFFAQSGLDEVGPDRNQIIDALTPEDREARLSKIGSGIHADVTAVRSGLPVANWISAITSRFEEREQLFKDTETTEIHQRARTWVAEIQNRVVNLAADTVGTYGAPVTAKLVESLVIEVDRVLADLQSELTKYDAWSSKQSQVIAGEFGSLGTGNLLANHPVLQEAIDRGLEAYEWRAEALTRGVAIDLIGDLKDNLLKPLLTALTTATDRLAAEEIGNGATPSIAAEWPVRDLVPQRFRPAPNERVIDPPERFPAVFSAQVRATVEADDPEGAQRQAVAAVLTGRRRANTAPQCLFRMTGRWVPRRESYRPIHSGPAAPARFEVDLSLNHLLNRATAWVNDSDPGNVIGGYIRQSLASCLEEEGPDQGERLGRFREALVSAIEVSAPLVHIDSGVLNAAHGRPEPDIKTIFTEIPFRIGHPAREIVETVLLGRGMLDADAAAAFGDGNQTRVDIFSHLAAPYQPVVFDSLLRPIAGAWGQVSATPDGRAEFWKWRRSRPLPSFVPLVPTVRRSIFRGWWTAIILNQLETPEEGPFSVYCPEVRRYVAFPYPLLGAEIYDPWERLPALLESLPLVWIDFFRGDLEALLPYARLRQLGMTERQSEEGYDRLNRELSGWISQGGVA